MSGSVEASNLSHQTSRTFWLNQLAKVTPDRTMVDTVTPRPSNSSVVQAYNEEDL
jgi:hypothetical protein